MSVRLVTTLALAGFLLVAATPSWAGDDPWLAFQPLMGQWRGEGSGFGSTSDITHEWSFALNNNFLRLRTRSVARADSGTGEIHEDVGYLSRDTDHATFVFRQFLSEGYVNTFDVVLVEGERKTVAFMARESESAGGMRAQMRLEFLSPTTYEMVLDLAPPGKEFKACQRMRLEKVR